MPTPTYSGTSSSSTLTVRQHMCVEYTIKQFPVSLLMQVDDVAKQVTDGDTDGLIIMAIRDKVAAERGD